MQPLPPALMNALKTIPGFQPGPFEQVHSSGEQVVSIRLNPGKLQIGSCELKIESPIPWAESGYYLSERPSFTFDPFFHAGCYYVQEASSMFLEQALKQTVDLSKPLRVLDLCAAPGGKSTHLQSLISKSSLLVSNEVIKSRCNILKDNIIKWGGGNVVVTNNDPKDFAGLENYFDVIVVDAPCSGSGLFRKEPDAIEHWSENNVNLCNQRQQRILADVWPALKRNGIIIYSTCSYSKEEDEDIVNWIATELNAEIIRFAIDSYMGILQNDPGLRFWPDKIKGEGFFISALKKSGGEAEHHIRMPDKLNQLSKPEIDRVIPWSSRNDFEFVHGFDGVYAVEKEFLPEINWLYSKLRTAYFGIKMGELKQNKMVPAHGLAMSGLVAASIPKLALELEDAIRYLQKKDITVEKNQLGWQLICYAGHPLGWANVLPGRINNYYPKELRILKDY